MKVTRLILGPLATNTYLIEEGDHILLIDPASKPERLFPYLEGKKVDAILLTHGHFDHIKAVDGLYKKYQMPVFLHSDDHGLASSKTVYQKMIQQFGFGATIQSPLHSMEEGVHQLGPFTFEAYHTPGHTKGSVLYRFGQDLFTGDTLFHGSVGRTDLEGGDKTELKHSLLRIRTMDPDLIIHPGHEEESILKEELEHNPYLI